MGKIVDITNKKFGKLKVIEISGKTITNTYLWKCLCECGNIKILDGKKLRNGHTKSCGCLRKLISSKNCIKLPHGEAAFNALYYSYKISTKNKKYTFNLSKNEFRSLTNNNCYYCDIKPYKKMFRKSFNGPYYYNGIDRIDNTKGYLIENCRTCCWECNQLKSSKNIKEFLMKIETIYNHRIKNES